MTGVDSQPYVTPCRRTLDNARDKAAAVVAKLPATKLRNAADPRAQKRVRKNLDATGLTGQARGRESSDDHGVEATQQKQRRDDVEGTSENGASQQLANVHTGDRPQ